MTASVSTNYISFVAHRALSGVLNGSFYGKFFIISVVSTIAISLLTTFAAAKMLKSRNLKKWQKVMIILSMIGCLLSIALTVASFINPAFALSDVHLWTLAQQICLSGIMFFGGMKIPDLFLAVYPSVFLQKISVNLLGGNAWDYIGTNDATGKTYNLPLLHINMPRMSSMYIRGALAFASIVTFIIIHHKKNKSWKRLLING